MKKVLIEQYIEGDYTIYELVKIAYEKLAVSKKEHLNVEFICQEPIYNENKEIIGVNTNIPAVVNIYKFEN